MNKNEQQDTSLPGTDTDKAIGSTLNTGLQKGNIHHTKNEKGKEHTQSEASVKAGEDALSNAKDDEWPTSAKIIQDAKNADQPWNGNNDSTANKLRQDAGKK